MEESRYLEMLDPYLVTVFGAADWPDGFTPRLLLGTRLHRQAVAHLQRDHGMSDPRTKNPDMLRMIERLAPAVDRATLVQQKYVRP